MARILGTPPLGWAPLALVAMAHAMGLWSMAAGRTETSARPAEMRFALAMAAPAAPSPPTPRRAEAAPVPAATTQPVAARPVTIARPAAARARQVPSPPPPPAPVAEAFAEAPATQPAVAALPAAASPGATAAEGADIPAVPPSFSADYLNNPKPDYPRVSRRLGEQGAVSLVVLVSADGQPQRIEVRQSSGHGRLDEAAMEAVRGWRFVPARRAGRPVPAEVRVPINFALENDR